MTDQNFINSNINKFEKLFYKRKISSIITLFDEDADLIDNVIYLKIDDNNHIGIFIDGANPYFSMSFIEDIDMFNLYENYNVIKCNSKSIIDFYVESIKMIFNYDYNELVGIYFSNNLETKSLSIIFLGDELVFSENLTFQKFDDEINNNLLHLKNKKIYSIGNNG